MAGRLPSRDEESAMWGRLEQRRNMRRAGASRVTPQSYQSLTGIQRSYPQLATGTKVSLAAAGVSPDDPVMQAVVQADQRVKKKKGFGFHSIGDFIDAGFDRTIGKGLEVAGDVLSPVGRAVSGVAKPVVRTGLMALAAPLEEAQGLMRNVASGLPGRSGEVAAGAGMGAAGGAAVGSVVPIIGTAIGAIAGGAIGGIAGALAPEVEGKPQWGPQSQLGIAAGRVASGRKVEAGSGWMPNAQTGLGQMQQKRAIAAAGIRNSQGEIVHGWTVGRAVADVVAEPGTTPYNILSGLVDAPVAIKFDPSAKALKGRNLAPTKQGAALRALQKDGLIDGARKTVLPEKVVDLLDHTDFGADLKAAVAGEKSPMRISKMFNGQLDDNPAALNALARAADEDEASALLHRYLGAEAARIPKTEISKRRVTRLLHNVGEDKTLLHRQAVNVPGKIEWDKPADAIRQLDAWLAIGKVDPETRLARMDEFIGALEGPITGRLPALDAAANSVADVLKANGVSAPEARQMTQLFKGSIEDARQYTAGTIVADDVLPNMVVNGDAAGLKSPFLYNEFLNHGVTLPDPREISDAVRWVKTLNHPLVKGTTATVDKAMYRWRQASILRAAYIFRVGGDQQARIFASGRTGLLNHPGELIMRIVAEKKGNQMPALTGVPIVDDEILRGGLARSRASEALRRPGVSMVDRARLKPGDGVDLFKEGWRDHELSRLHTDTLGRMLARMRRTGNASAVDDEIPEAAAVFDGFDDPIKTALSDARPGGPAYASVDEIKQSFWDGPLAKLRRDLQGADESALLTREQADTYVDQVNQWIDDFTKGDDRLLEYIHRGPKEGVNERVAAAMDELLENGNHPEMVVGSRTGRMGGEVKSHFDRFVDTAFDWIATKPDNLLAREPVLAEDYWRAVERMFPALDGEGRDWALRLADESGNKKVAEALRARAGETFDGDLLTRDDVHRVAAFEATENTKKLLYDVSIKSKWADATRLIFPFAEPWKEAMTIWPKLLVENPATVRRLDQTVQGARGAGFFQKDEQTGEEMFVYPGSQFISKMLVGAPIPLRGSAAGLNLFASNPVMPGMGPLVQVAANQLLPEKPDFDWIRSVVSPYGRADTSSGFVESFLPAWSQKFRKAMESPESDRLFNNTTYDMANYLLSTGEFSLDSPEAQEELSAAAVSMAKRMYLLRGMASFVSPSAPSPQAIAEDKDGRIVTQFALAAEYRALQKDPGEKTMVNGHEIEGVGYNQAVGEFLERYGEDALLLMQPKTKGGGSPLDDTMDWVRENPELAKRYDDVYQYFAPHSGKYDQTAYERQIATGKRQVIGVKEGMEAANSRVASMLMRQARAKVGAKTSDSERKWLSNVQAALIEEYPGYNPQSFDAGRVPAAIRQLEDALGEEKMAGTDNGRAIGLYLEARKKAQAAAEEMGLSGFSKAKRARGTRDWLRAVAAAITEETPEFATVWDQLLSHELASDVEQTTTV